MIVNKLLINDIRNLKTLGYSSQQLYNYFVQRGYNPNEVKEALVYLGYNINDIKKTIDFVSNPQASSSSNKNFVWIGMSAIIIIAVVGASFIFLTRPVCNSDVECNDNNINTLDRCINPSERISKCLYAQQTQLSDIGKEIIINQKESVSFKINDEDHLIQVEEVTDNSATFTIYSEPQKLTLTIGQSEEIDVNNDGLNDLYIKLVRISDGKPIFEIKSLENQRTESFSYDYDAETRQRGLDSGMTEAQINESLAQSGSVNLEILSSKTIYQIAEPVSGEFKFSYSGKQFNGIVLYTYSKEGFNKKYYAIMRGSISSSNINMMRVAFKAFKLDDYGYLPSTDYFYNEGNYQYTLAVYNCETVTSKLNKDCFNVNIDPFVNELTNVNPIKTLSKTIKVQGGTRPSECRENKDCTKTCAGCKDGKQKCEIINEKCMDCIIDAECKSGYKCKNDACISWECDTNADCSDDDASTKDTCANFKCSSTKIITCMNNDLYCPTGCDANNDNDCTSKCGSQIIDCGTNQLVNDCFINAAKDCCSAKIVTEWNFNDDGVIIKSKSYREIKSLESEKCVVFQRTESFSYDYDAETRQRGLDSGMTEAQINEPLVQQNLVAQEIVGKDTTCKYPPVDLVEKLEIEKQGIISPVSSKDYKYQCTNFLFGTGSLFGLLS